MHKSSIDPSLAGSRFAPVNNICRRCGKPTNTVSLTCHSCLKQIYFGEEMERTRELLLERPRQALELGHSRDRGLHLVLFSAPKLGWCGAEISETRSKRKRIPAERFPPELCAACLTLYREVAPCP